MELGFPFLKDIQMKTMLTSIYKGMEAIHSIRVAGRFFISVAPCDLCFKTLMSINDLK
jgi:hypothetical protein